MGATQLLILVVDDEKEPRSLLNSVLSDEGYKVEEASNGQEALDMLANVSANLVLLDIMMPVMNGLQFATEARERYADVPILVLTGEQHPIEWAAKMGAVGFLAKPFDLATLLTAVSSLAKRP